MLSRAYPAIELVKKREGLELKWYKDSLGKTTGGYGHLQLPHEVGTVVTKELAEKWLAQDMQVAMKAARLQATKLPFSSQEFEDVLVSVNFQLGTGWTEKFPKTWGLMLSGKYEEAAWEVENSLWAKQTPVRVRDLQRALWRLSLLQEVYSLQGV